MAGALAVLDGILEVPAVAVGACEDDILVVDFTPERETVVIPVGTAIPGPVDIALVVEA